MKSRTAALKSIRDQAFDVCIIGGGATGLGSALDAQMRGLRTVVIDAGDFVSKTSSASTKLAHGGVRYLQQAVAELDYRQFQMVRKALQERTHMLRAAPYLARPLELLVPCFSHWQMLYFAVGMKIYDVIAGKSYLPPSRILSRKQTQETLPSLRMEKVAGSVTYADGQFDDARYGIAMAKTIAQKGGELLNHAKVVGFVRGADGKLASAHVEDLTSGEQFMVSAGVFLNCTGPFADTIRLQANPLMKSRLRVSKGIHILLPIEALQSETALLIPSTEDGRVIFAIPWFGSLLVGTTEDEVTLSEEVIVNESEVAYLLKYVNRYLDIDFTPSDVLAAFAGVRPLVASKDAVNTKRLVRDHEVEIDESSGLISILGGKWTTYRAMAEDGIDHVESALGRQVSASKTRDMPFTGAAGFIPEYWRELVFQYGVNEATAKQLAHIFGTDAPQLLASIPPGSELAKPIYDDAAFPTGAVLYCVREEMAQTIDDVLARRLGLQVHSWEDALKAAPVVARILGRELGWEDGETERAIKEYILTLRRWTEKAAVSFINWPSEAQLSDVTRQS